MRPIRGSLILAAAGLALAVSGCAAEADPAAPPAASDAPPSADTPTPGIPSTDAAPPQPVDGIAPGFTAPACEEQVDAATVQAAFGADVSFIADVSETWEPVGPAAQEAAASADQVVACLWGVPNSGRATEVVVAELGEQPRDALMTALREDDAFTEEELDSGLVFTAEGIQNGDVVTSLAYVFDGAAWIAVGGGELPDAATARDVALAAQAALAP